MKSVRNRTSTQFQNIAAISYTSYSLCPNEGEKSNNNKKKKTEIVIKKNRLNEITEKKKKKKESSCVNGNIRISLPLPMASAVTVNLSCAND